VDIGSSVLKESCQIWVSSVFITISTLIRLFGFRSRSLDQLPRIFQKFIYRHNCHHHYGSKQTNHPTYIIRIKFWILNF
jgi:hypothetical protein